MSKRYPGGYLTASPVVPTATAAPGVWTLEQQYQAQGAGNWPAAANYQINKSLRFRSSASAYLNRTPSAGNQTTWTFSAWVKRGELSASGTYTLLSATSASPESRTIITFEADGSLDFFYYNGTSYPFITQTSALYRDPAAWYHVVVVYNSTDATSSNRIKMYVNGSQITSFQTATYPSQNTTSDINSTKVHNIGRRGAAGNDRYFDGYMAEVNFIDGQQLTPSSFGTTDAYGIWQPIPYSGAYGTNGFYLPFTNTTSTTTLGYDSSGNGNNWTTNNFSLTSGSTYDSMYDSPTNNSSTVANYAVLNPLQIASAASYTITNGNLQINTNAGSSYNCFANGTIFPATGKWYAEFQQTGGTRIFVGISRFTDITTPNNWNSYSTYYINTGEIQKDGSTITTGATYTTGDVIGVAYDADSATCAFYKNNSLQGTVTGVTSGLYTFSVNGYQSGVAVANFGQQPFVYTPPTGFLPLNTYNLPDSNVPVGNKVMDDTTYTGNSASRSIVNAGGFQPDLVWIKARNDTTWHQLFDSVRGANKGLFTNSNYQEVTETDAMNSFNSNGFGLGADVAGGSVNLSGDTYAGWQWQAGQGTTSSNTNGSITSTVSSNPTAGFSVFTFNSGSSGTQTVGHGLGVYPGMIFFKDRSTGYWNLWHRAFSNPAQGYMYLDLTNALANDASQWSNTAPTSSVFTYNSGYSWTASHNMVAYAWAPVAGYSSFGSYTGNGSTDGPFIYTGFRPKFIFIKCMSTAGENSMQYDTSINPYNAAQEWLSPNLSAASNTAGGYYIDFVSNGVKIRQGGPTGNGSGRTYLYAAFAENPFKMARAR